MLSKWKEQINQKNLGRFSSLANVVLFLCMAGLLPSGAKQFTPLTILVYILLGLWAVSTLLYFVLKKRYVSLLPLLCCLFYRSVVVQLTHSRQQSPISHGEMGD